MAIEIVDFPIKNGGSFHSYVSHYQRVRLGKSLPKRLASCHEVPKEHLELRSTLPFLWLRCRFQRDFRDAMDPFANTGHHGFSNKIHQIAAMFTEKHITVLVANLGKRLNPTSRVLVVLLSDIPFSWWPSGLKVISCRISCTKSPASAIFSPLAFGKKWLMFAFRKV